ncbi:MAG TPA: hypothetical protein PKA64_25350, partial [Myxococcota bacterium]|nr:hypothetical protein [Myxococcota bacterium]
MHTQDHSAAGVRSAAGDRSAAGSSSVDLDLLSGALQVAEAQVRWLMAEALPPASQYRVEREATLRAHATLRGVQVKRTIELPPGWAELVEVDDA